MMLVDFRLFFDVLAERKALKLTAEFHRMTDKCFWYADNFYAASEHGGTHADAPLHFAAPRNSDWKILPILINCLRKEQS